jgi:hypothetical protein
MPDQFTNDFVHSFLENRHTSIEPSYTGRKGIAYDWQQLLIPDEAVIEASLEIMLNSDNAGEKSSPIASA